MAQGLINNGVSVTKSFLPNQLELLKDYTVLDSAITSYTFSGLKLNADEEIVLKVSYKSSSSGDIYIYVNGNTTATNYYAQYFNVNNTAVGGSRLNAPWFTGASSPQMSLCTSVIKLTNNGFFTYQAESIREYGTTTPYIYNFYGTSTFTLGQITSLTLGGPIDIGSRFQLYKVKGQVQQTWATT